MLDHKEYCSTCLSEDRSLTPARLLSSFFNGIDMKEIAETNGGVCWECQSLIMKFNRYKQQAKIAQQTLNQKVSCIQPLSKLKYQIKDKLDFVFSYDSDPLTYKEVEFDSKYLKEETIDELDDVNTNYDYKEDIPIEDIYVEHIDNKIIGDSTDEFNEVNVVNIDGNINTIGITEDNANETLKANIQGNNMHSKKNKLVRCKKRLMNKKNLDITLKNLNTKQKRIKRERGRVKREERDKNPQEDFEEKFESVVLSEGEMIRNREEKRNQPNFKKIPYKCDSCVLGFLRKENYDVHLIKKHDEKIGPYTCPVCNIRFPNQRSTERHKTKHYTIYRCKLCKYDTVELWSAINHCKVKHSGDRTGRIHCPQCLSVNKTPQELEEHIRREHTLCCNECGGKFKGKNTLRSHKARVHATKREYACELCRKCFNSESRLESHMAGHESSVARRLAYCSVCDVQYKNIYVYRSHLRNSANHADTLYTCPDCNKKFASKVYWSKHYNFYHLHKSQYTCDVCNKLFISAWRLKNHKQKYHGLTRPRDHACGVCGKKFFTLSTLRGHVLTHSEERTYMCEDCGDTFKQRPALYTHSRLVHKEGRKAK